MSLALQLLGFFCFTLGLGAQVHVAPAIVALEAIALLSFLMIGHYVARPAAVRGAFFAFAISRGTDMGLLAISGWVFWNFSNSAFPVLGLLTLACGMKSVAGFAFLWLTDAMEGPSPVSALLHAATLVLAGIVVFMKMEKIGSSQNYLAAGVSGCVLLGAVFRLDGDSKKMAALSTISALCLT